MYSLKFLNKMRRKILNLTTHSKYLITLSHISGSDMFPSTYFFNISVYKIKPDIIYKNKLLSDISRIFQTQ